MTRARELADLAASADTSGLTNRNMVMNGEMRIAQRNTTISSITSSTDGPCDRWQTFGSSFGTYTASQSTTTPTGEGFGNSFKLDNTAADASPSAGDHFGLKIKFEGQDLQPLKKGTSSALSTTVSFWVRSNKTGTYTLELDDRDNTRSFSKSYTISSADTWEHKTLTFAGDTTGALGNDNQDSFHLNWWLMAGSNFTSGTFTTGWESRTNANRVHSSNVNLSDSTSNEWYLTGVQWEIGETDTTFERVRFSDDLARCQRYFCKSYDYADAVGTATQIGGVYDRMGASEVVSNRAVQIRFPVEMRGEPSVAVYSLNGTVGAISDCQTSYSHDADDDGVSFNGTDGTSGLSKLQGNSVDSMIGFHFTADAELQA